MGHLRDDGDENVVVGGEDSDWVSALGGERVAVQSPPLAPNADACASVNRDKVGELLQVRRASSVGRPPAGGAGRMPCSDSVSRLRPVAIDDVGDFEGVVVRQLGNRSHQTERECRVA